ncbi:PRC-barrel domain-containing protein (plasmid) [Legionella adelaidensis]|uniref:PRC-barrel domain protein n=1 Tax=Legionella adelaidensis TaxID=45056 RepID=A0A0W0R1M4_9GAMM|nr:PRC-barrel domain-containing protein [Legionella adelaidensis]KTC64991.1 PRC-barrel domain protein [Legionella adelaidensis]VEH85329.1 PRC-barrel domain-containing protein [Legionella adelaidensis]
MELVRANEDVIGKSIENPQGESLGEIEELMLDKVAGTVEYVVVSFGGFLGLGEKLFAMPWSIFNYNKERECFVITVDKEKLENAPGFDRDHWPDISSPTWTASINNYYGIRPHH